MQLSLINRNIEAPDIESFVFEPVKPLAWKAGQFLRYFLPHEPVDDRGQGRWFTISSAPSEGVVMLTTRFSDDKGSTFKRALHDLKIGDSIEASEADGSFVIDDTSASYVFIAGGIGITPFRSMLKEMHAQGIPLAATLLYANRDEHIPFKEELAAIAKDNQHLHIRYVISPERIDEDRIQQLVPDLAKPLFYVSGPEPMVKSVATILKALGIPSDRIKQDWFPGYPAE